MDDTTTQLLTLLNVSALKRKRVADEIESPKLNKKKKIAFALDTSESQTAPTASLTVSTAQEDEQNEDAPSEPENYNDNDVTQTSYKMHFAPDTTLLSEKVRDLVEQNKWSNRTVRLGKLGSVLQSTPEHSVLSEKKGVSIPERLRSAYDSRASKLSLNQSELRADILSAVSGYQDLFITKLEIEQRQIARDVITLHALNHIFNIRRRVLKNNERLTQASKDTSADPPTDVQDQGFTRPSVLIVLPFRSSAVQWTEAILSQLPSHQVENRTRFMSEFSLPPGTVDKLTSAEPGTYPRDHVEMFKGNVDDNFRIGVKLTKKSVKIFANFYSCDLIIASPLGLRMSIEKEKSSDFLSSIEVLVVDQMDALTMQNWEHLQFVLDRLNKLPKESHDADFSRIKPWYLDGHAAYLRQSILMSPYETPEMRSLFTRTLKNVAGKLKTERKWKPVDVPEGVEQNFASFECPSPKAEADKRFEYFTTRLLPVVLKSAVQSTNTIIFVPSSFDFIRVQNHLRKLPDASVAVLSEYSSNQDISRARQAFFTGKKRFLLMSERFHFYRRYRIRGVRNLLFYGPPDHAQFYTELLSYPFLDDGVDSSDVSCRVLYCKYDYMGLERIAGSEGVASLVQRN